MEYLKFSLLFFFRQESTDSGLGMGSNFNLGVISEDVGMESMETDLDTTLTEASQVQIVFSYQFSNALICNGCYYTNETPEK